MDPLDLADPIRLIILLLPERFRAPAAALLSALVATQLIAASIIARLPLAAARDPRWGRVVRALHWYSLLRFRDEKGTVKAIGGDVAPRVTPAPVAHPRADEIALCRATVVPPEPIAPVAFDPSAHITRADLPPLDGQRVPDPRDLVIASQAEELTRLREALAAYQRRAEGTAHPAQIFAPRFDPTARQTIAPEVAAQIAGETLPR